MVSINVWSHVTTLIVLLQFSRLHAFAPNSIIGRSVPSPIQQEDTSSFNSNVVLFMGKKRRAQQRNRVEKQSKGRPDKFKKAIDEVASGGGDDDDDDEVEKKPPPPDANDPMKRKASEAQKRMDERPEISTMVVDEETGIEVIQQGKNVMDVVTRKAVKLSDLGPEYRLAQMFPGVPPEVRDQYRFDWNTIEVPQMVTQLADACNIKIDKDGTLGIPDHPNVANKAIDFVTANRDYLGFKMKRTLGRLAMRSMSLDKKDEAREYNKLWKHFLLLENHISAPFRQMILDGEGRMGPNFGNLDLKSYANGDLYERVANYLVLKSMVANWEKKVRDAEYIEKTPQTKENFVSILARGDPKRYLPDPPILFTLRECTQVCLMAQQMTKTFVETPELFSDLPPEVRFLEQALTIQGGTALRQFMVEDFCPKENITPEGLREGMRRLYQQLENMQLDPYGDITNIISRLIKAMSVGTDDERDPYEDYLGNTDPNGPGFFQTYTFNHDKLSIVRFLDAQYERDGQGDGGIQFDNDLPSSMEQSSSAFDNFFSTFGGAKNEKFDDSDFEDGPTEEEEVDYKVPALRALGRPHNLGWLDMFKEEDEKSNLKFGQVPAGRIIPDDEC